MMLLTAICLSSAFALGATVQNSDGNVLNGQGPLIAEAFLKGQVQQMSARPVPPNPTAYEVFRTKGKKELMRMLGLDPMPLKTPLNARVTGVLKRQGYRIEKVVFESRPRFYVTTHVYIPEGSLLKKGKVKMPVIVNVNGHWKHKKGEDRVQLRAAFQALHGYIAIAIDSPGRSYEGANLFERGAEGDHNDFALLAGGPNTTGYYVWDAIRALDYMSTRSDADMTRIGITGASGGGLATLYTFAADERYTAAAPVVFMASLEMAPYNGCICNHVAATCQIGDRCDVLGLQAPKPVLIMGADDDWEFPREAMTFTGEKVRRLWDVFGKGGDTLCQIFAGTHDYNQPMRERMIGFFNKYLKKVGNGSPVPQPPISAFDSEDRQLLVLDPPPADERTMRELSLEYLANAPTAVPASTAISINGGVPALTDMKYKELGAGLKRHITLESEPGLVTPGVLVLPEQASIGVRIVVADSGKHTVVGQETKPGFAVLYLDTLGVGELSQLDLKYAVYTGRSIPFLGGWQIVRAAEAMRRYSTNVEIVGIGPISSQSVMWAALMDRTFAKVEGKECLRSWADVFEPTVSNYAIQPRAHLCGSLENLRSQIPLSTWTLRP
jgi:dienelactone hydrolase